MLLLFELNAESLPTMSQCVDDKNAPYPTLQKGRGAKENDVCRGVPLDHVKMSDFGTLGF